MARIYIGRSTGIGSFERHVVLKMILPEKANDHTAVQMFLDEARLAASLNHQNVAQVFEVGEDGGVHFLAMEYVHGQDLRALLAKAGSEGTRVPLELALTVVAGAAAGLNHAHERRTSDGVPMDIVHRDVSPSNIMIGYDGAVKLLDFGIAKAAARSVETQSGIIKGKFAYMAPEQCRGRDVDRRSDVFSLGIILYEVTTQHRCFRADSDFDTMHRIVTGDVVRPTRLVHGYPQALEAIVMKALAIDQTQRYQSAGLLLEAIESFAVAARMSLSTMALGRFMRDMFGDVQEPWLVPGRISQLPQPKEHTISNTNATGGGRPPARQSTPPQPQPQPQQLPLLYEEAPLHLPPEVPLLDHPHDQPPYAAPSYDHQSRDHLSHDRQSRSRLPHDVEDVSRSNVSRSNAGVPGWTAQEYPSAPQVYASAVTPPPEERPSAVQLPGMVPQVSPVGLAGGTPQIPPSQFAVPSGSTSGPAHSALPLGSQLIARTRQDYTGAPGASQNQSQSGISYPNYEPPYDPDADVDLQPSNRLLYIGAGIVLIGIIVVLAISILNGRPDDVSPTKTTSSGVAGVTPGSDEPNNEATNPEAVRPGGTAGGTAGALKPDAVKPEAFRPEMTVQVADVDAGVAPISDESIRIHVVSVPPGADVLLAGKPIGATPLDTKIRRGTGLAMLTVHHAKFEDMTMTIDLSGDFKRELTLTPVPDEPVKPPTPIREPNRPPVSHTQTHDGPREGGRPHAPPTPAPPSKKCQPPDKYNPFDTTCGGQPCPVCK